MRHTSITYLRISSSSFRTFFSSHQIPFFLLEDNSMSNHLTYQSSFLQLRLHYISIILFLLICNGCKSDCEKAAAFSAADYDTMSEALDHKAIVDMKCKNEIDAMNLDEKTAAQKYCDYTKKCSTINRT